MTYLEILNWARRGIAAEKEKMRDMQERAIEGGAHGLMRTLREEIDSLDVKAATLDELEEIRNRK